MQITYSDEQSAIRPLLEPANINSDSFLATDYLNHYNEILMLLEMVPDMPDLLDDAADWRPKAYTQHFMDSGFQAKELAIQAYGLAPSVYKSPFETICGKLDHLISATLSGLLSVNIVERGLSEAAQSLIRTRIDSIQELLMDLNQVIHGASEHVDNKGIPETQALEQAGDIQSQEDIDLLFD